MVDGVDGEKLLFDPIDGGLVRIFRRRNRGGAVADKAGLAFDALHLIAGIDTGHPVVEAAKIFQKRPDLIRSGGLQLCGGFSFPFGLCFFCHQKR